MNLITLISEIFGLKTDQITDKTSRTTCVEWTSLKHVELMVALEELCDIDFTSHEIAAATDVGRLWSLLTVKGVAVITPYEAGSTG